MIVDVLAQVVPIGLQFGALFGGIWLLKRLIRYFGPMLKMRGKPWD